MRLWHRKGSRFIAILLVGALAQVYIQFAFAQQPPQFIARLTATRNGQPILVNGNSTPVGSAITPGSIIETGADQSATINLDNGVLEVGQNTSLRLDFEQGKVKITLTRGCAILRTKSGNEGEIATEQESVAKTDKNKNDEAAVCFLNGNVTQGPAARTLMMGVSTSGAAAGGGGLGTAAWIAIGGGIIAAVVLPIVAFRGNNPSPS
jgi:hypothetical protein